MDVQYFEDSVGALLQYEWVQILLTIVIAMLVLMVVRASVDGVVRRVVARHRYASKEDEEKREDTLITIFHTIVAALVWTVAFFIVLGQLHINIAALLTGAGVVSVVVGFGAQNSIKDFLAGIYIIAENQYRVGDIVSVYAAGKDVAGVVEDISIRITRLRDLDGNLHTIPNGGIIVVTNLSFDFANVNVNVRVGYDADIDKVEKVMNKVGADMAKDKVWADAIVEPIQFLRVDAFGESAIDVKALGKVEPAMQWDVAGEFRRRIKVAFTENGIEVPYPQIVVRNAKSKTT
jgi:moderate conductance mechanosensitive channel